MTPKSVIVGVFALGISSTIVISCNENNLGVNSGLPGAARSITSSRDTTWLRYHSDYFPHQIGSQWTYAVVDSAPDLADTLLVTIIGAHWEPNGVLRCPVQLRSKLRVDTSDISLSRDGRFTLDWLVSEGFDYPLYVGKSWGCETCTTWSHGCDCSNVISESAIQVPAGEFTESYFVQRNWSYQIGAFSQTTWYVPSVGVARTIIRNETLWNYPMLQVLELLQYSPANTTRR